MGSTPTFGTNKSVDRLSRSLSADDNGAWLSLVERSVRDAEVGGSNPLAPTTKNSFSIGAVFLLDTSVPSGPSQKP